MSKINAIIIADSVDCRGNRLTSLLITLPRFLLSELNTHRMLSKNSASSRAIPFNKMVEAVQNNPFIPIAWQKDHKGMQGTEYHLNPELQIKTWLEARDYAIRIASNLNNKDCNVTKQLCNRLLEPFMWTTMLITGSREGWNNFFKLRNPQYDMSDSVNGKQIFKSKKDVIEIYEDIEDVYKTDLDWLKLNKGQAEIHIMDLAEKIYDAMTESTPKQLEAGEWHIPFEDKINIEDLIIKNNYDNIDLWEEAVNKAKVKISTAMAARTSYTVVGDEKEFTYEQQIALHDRMANQVPFHASPFEHCARAMSDEEYNHFIRGEFIVTHSEPEYEDLGEFPESAKGWCRNYKGFIQYREILENGKI